MAHEDCRCSTVTPEEGGMDDAMWLVLMKAEKGHVKK
jgi:hypothetical protein